MQTEQASLEAKNHELVDAFKERTKSQQQTRKLYESLKAQVMASHVANAAGDEAEFALQTARGNRFIDRLPGTRSGTANFNRLQAGGRRQHERNNSRSSGSSGQQQGSIGIGPPYSSYLQGRGMGSRMHTGRESTPFLRHQAVFPAGSTMHTSRVSWADLIEKNLLQLARHLKLTGIVSPWLEEHVRTRTLVHTPVRLIKLRQ